MASEITYTYEIASIDILQGTMAVNYIPDSIELSPLKFNMRVVELPHTHFKDDNGEVIYASQSDVPFDVIIDRIVKDHAPIETWKCQNFMLTNLDALTAKITV